MSAKRLPNGALYQIGEVEGIDNASLVEAYLRHRDDEQVKRSHLFEGRYENVYIPRQMLPALEPVFTRLLDEAGRLLDRPADELKLGFWLNGMEPGQRTLPHSHDDWDELISTVYYIQVPQGSGHLVLEDGAQRAAIAPRAGRFVMFSPAVVHEVTANHSHDLRLSVGINIGPVEDDLWEDDGV